MAKPFRPKRGTTAENNAFIGLPYEVTLDTERHSLHIHDGITAGGFELMPKDLTDGRYIRTVNGQTPDINGNVEVAGGGGTGDASSEEILEAARRVADVEVDPAIAEVQALQTEVARVATELDGVVRSVNGETPDENGNVEITVGGGAGTVTSVNGVGPDASGNVTIDFPEDAVTSVNGQTGAVVVDTGVMTVNGNAPDASGNVVVSVPDSGVQAVNGIGPDASGNVTIDVGVTKVNGQSGEVTIDIPDVPVQSVNGQTGAVVVDTGVMTVNGNAPTSGNITTDQLGALPLTGGTMTGAVTFNVENAYVQKANANGRLLLRGGTSTDTDGARISLHGTNASTYPGAFLVLARTADGTSTTLKGEGTALTWANKNIARSVNSVDADAAGNVAVDVGVKTVNGNAPDANGNITPAQTGCLPTTGGTIGGNVAFSQENATISKQDGNGRLTLRAGLTDGTDAASLALYGTGAGTYPGAFILSARKADGSGGTALKGEEGALTWNGKHLVRSVNGVFADEAGNVSIATGGGGTASGVQTVNNVGPDASGNVNIDVGVKKVNGISPTSGNVTIDTGVMTVNGVAPTSGNVAVDVGVTSVNGQSGAVTIDIPDVPVQSVNGQTGAVVIDTGVMSVNGQTGTVTLDVGVTSVNGQTGEVTIDVPDVPVQSVNGMTGAVTVDTGVMTVNGIAPTSGNVTLQTNDFVSKGTNPVADVANDTTTVWKAIEGGIYYYNQTGCLTDQPSQYGVLTHIVNGNNVYQQFKGLPSGALYYRSGTSTGWSISWTKLATADATVSSVNGNTGAVTALQTGCIPFAGSRDQPAGYYKITNTFEPLEVNGDTLDFVFLGNRSAINVPDGAFATAWTKVVGLNQANVSITLGANWKWKGGVAPATKAKSLLVLRWYTNFGIAEIVDETPISIDTGVMTVNGISPTSGNVDIDVGALKVNGVSPDADGNVTIPTGNSDEILEAARRVSIVDVDVATATIQSLQTAIASLEARVAALENP